MTRRKSSAASAPKMDPPAGHAADTGLNEAPSMDVPQTNYVLRAVSEAPAPTQTPPSEAVMGGEEEGIAAWLNNRKITALWSNQASRNAYIAIAGIGWRKLYNGNDSALLTMTILAAHAEQTDANTNVRIESDNMVHEIYVW